MADKELELRAKLAQYEKKEEERRLRAKLADIEFKRRQRDSGLIQCAYWIPNTPEAKQRIKNAVKREVSKMRN